MAGFQRGVESEVRSTFRHAAKIAGEAFAIGETFRFGKEIVQHAAEVQKQVEVIAASFGDASKEVLDFNEKGAAALGVSAHAADETSARLGILFANLKIAPGLAAKMTVGFEKLAGATAAIRGIDPAQFLRQLPLVAAGNVRGLKQMGISLDQTQLKVVAFKLGLTASVKAALNPAQKAVAIYAYAMQNLDRIQGQAQAHAGDLLNVQRRLSAEWDNAKDKLGAGLLPVMTTLATALTRVLPPAIDLITKGFRDLAFTVTAVAKYLVPVFDPIIERVQAVKEAFKTQGAGAGLEAIKAQFLALGPVAKIAALSVLYLAASFGAAVLAASPFLATTALVAGLAVGFAEAYKRSDTFREKVQELKAFLTAEVVPALERVNDRIGPGLKSALDSAIQIVTGFVSLARAYWKRFGDDTLAVLRSAFKQVVNTFQSAARSILDVLRLFADVLHGRWRDAWHTLADLAKTELRYVWNTVKNTLGLFKTIGTLLVHAIAEGVRAAAGALEVEVLKLVAKVLDEIGKIPTRFSIKGHGVGFKNPASSAASAVKGQIAGILDARAAKSLADSYTKNTQAALSARTRDITEAYVAPVKEAVKRTAAATKDDAKAAGSTTGKAYGDGVNSALSTAGENSIRSIQQRLHEAIVQTAADVKQAVTDAQRNLTGLGSTLANQLGDIVDNGPLGKTLKRIQDQIAGTEARQQAKQIRQTIVDATNALQVATGKAARVPLSDAVTQARGLRATLSKANKDLKTARDAIVTVGPVSSKQQAAIAKFLKPQLDAVKQAQGALGNFVRDQRQAVKGGQRDFAGFSQQQVIAALQKRQEAVKQALTTRIANLTDAFNRGLIDEKGFRAGITKVLGGQMHAFVVAGKTLGTAFALSFNDQIAGLLIQTQKIQQARDKGLPGLFGIGSMPEITNPVGVLNKQLVVQQQIRDELARTRKQQQAAANAKAAKKAEGATHTEDTSDLTVGATG